MTIVQYRAHGADPGIVYAWFGVVLATITEKRRFAHVIYRIVNRPIVSLPLLVMVIWPFQSQAADSQDVIKYRRAVMKSQGAHAEAASEIIKGKVSYDSDLSYHAAALNSSTHDLVKLFPKGSDFGETRAKAEIWSKRGEFEKVANDAEKAGSAFLAAVNSGDTAAIRKAFGDLGEACKSCHKQFRERKE
jgi:cytochrome c556